MASLILNGHRGMSKETIKKLCARSDAGPAVFFPLADQQITA